MDLPSVGTPGSNKCRKLKQQRVGSTGNIGIVDEATSQRQEVINMCKVRATLQTNSNESLVHVINAKKLAHINRQPVISPNIGALKNSNNPKNAINFRSSKNFHSLVSTLSQNTTAFQKLQAPQHYNRSTSQEYLNGIREVSPTKKKASKFFSADSCEASVAHKNSDFTKTQSAQGRRESPAHNKTP